MEIKERYGKQLKRRCAKRNGPVQNTCKTSYGYFANGVSKIHNAVRLNARQTLNECMLDETTRAQIGLFASKLIKNVAYYVFNESCKCVPGGKAVAEIVSKTIEDVNLENKRNQETVAMKQKIRLSTKKNTNRKLIEQVKVQSKGVDFSYEKQDMLRAIMLKLENRRYRKMEDMKEMFRASGRNTGRWKLADRERMQSKGVKFGFGRRFYAPSLKEVLQYCEL